MTERWRKSCVALTIQRVLMDEDNTLLANSISEQNYQPLENVCLACRVIFNAFQSVVHRMTREF